LLRWIAAEEYIRMMAGRVESDLVASTGIHDGKARMYSSAVIKADEWRSTLSSIRRKEEDRWTNAAVPYRSASA
jgi:hypothetical protein